MIELHGWVTIRATYSTIYAEDLHEEKYDHMVVEKIKLEIERLLWFKPKIRAMNGDYYSSFDLFCNHKSEDVKEILMFFERIGKIAEGSYGLIYMYDDEDDIGKDNQFQVWVLARGIVKKYDDTFLSPFIPKVEDRWL